MHEVVITADLVYGRADRVELHDPLVSAGASSTLILLGGSSHEGPEFDEATIIALRAGWLRAMLGSEGDGKTIEPDVRKAPTP